MSKNYTTLLGQGFDNESLLSLSALARRLPDTEYLQVPEGATVPERGAWRLLLMRVDRDEKPIALKICGDTALGSWEGDDPQADVNLSVWNGYDLGVSRRHLLLRMGIKKLFVLDLKSTNGTHINGLPLGVGWAYPLQDGDLLTLGQLHIRVRIAGRPDR